MRSQSFKCPICRQDSFRSTFVIINGNRKAVCRSCGNKLEREQEFANLNPRQFGISKNYGSKMDTERLVWEHDKIIVMKEIIERKLKKRGIVG